MGRDLAWAGAVSLSLCPLTFRQTCEFPEEKGLLRGIRVELEEKPRILLSLGAEPSTPCSNPRTRIITLVFPTMLFGLGEPSP